MSIQITSAGGSGTSFSTVVACYSSTNGATPTGGIIDFNNKLVDSANAVTTGPGNWKFTVPVGEGGAYEATVYFYIQTTASVQHSIELYINSIPLTISYGPNSSPFAGTIPTGLIINLVPGDIIQCWTTWSTALPTMPGEVIINIKKIH